MRTSKPIKVMANGYQVKIPRIVYAEPALWDIYDRKAAQKEISRSDLVRATMKKSVAGASGINEIDWSEIELA